MWLVGDCRRSQILVFTNEAGLARSGVLFFPIRMRSPSLGSCGTGARAARTAPCPAMARRIGEPTPKMLTLADHKAHRAGLAKVKVLIQLTTFICRSGRAVQKTE